MLSFCGLTGSGLECRRPAFSLAPSHVPQYQTFHTEGLMFNLLLTKSSQQRKAARHCRNPIKSSIIIFILRSKNIIVLWLYW